MPFTVFDFTVFKIVTGHEQPKQINIIISKISPSANIFSPLFLFLEVLIIISLEKSNKVSNQYFSKL